MNLNVTSLALEAPVEVHIELSDHCSLGCPHCPFCFGSLEERLSTEEMCRVLTELRRHDVLHVLFLAPGHEDGDSLCQVVRTAASLDQSSELLLGGSIPEGLSWRSLKRAGLRAVILEFFGSQSFHDQLTAPGCYGRMMEALQASVESGLPTVLLLRLLRGASGPWQPLLRDVPRSLAAIVGQFFIPFKPGQEQFTISEAEALRLVEGLRTEAFPLPVRYASCARSPSGLESKLCSAGRFKVSMDAAGNYLPCEHFCRRSEALLGNALKGGLPAAWNHALLTRIRALGPETYQGVCGICVDRYHCSSCRALGFNYGGDVSLDQPFCDPARAARTSHE